MFRIRFFISYKVNEPKQKMFKETKASNGIISSFPTFQGEQKARYTSIWISDQ